MSLSEELYQAAIEELADGHLALDRLGSPREFDADTGIRELTIAERIRFIFPLRKLVSVESYQRRVAEVLELTMDNDRMAMSLRDIADIAEGSTTANSLPHIAKIARSALPPAERGTP